MPSLVDKIQHAFLKRWNAFGKNRDPTYPDIGPSYYYRPDRRHFSCGNERSIVTSVYNQIAIDAASVDIFHVKLDENDRYLETINSSLNNCLTTEANLDQTGRAFKQDIYMSLIDEGCIAIVPVETDVNPENTESFKIYSMRVGKIVQWYPKKVKVQLYNEETGKKEEVIVSKNRTAIVENPFYSVMNEKSSTMQRLIRKLNLLDAIDEQSGAGKLDMVIQLPYVIKSDARKKQAEDRRKLISDQLENSKYGIAYIDGTERITQLNRPVENNLMKQIEYLTSMLYSQLGITQSILDGTADDKTMLNYYTRTVEPLINAVVDEMKRKFLSKTARTQKQSIMYFRDIFKLVPVNDMAEIADKFTRNEVATSNEMRQVMGWKPSKDPKADQLRNSNLNHPDENTETIKTNEPKETVNEGGQNQNGEV